jgi:hypothetical protein
MLAPHELVQHTIQLRHAYCVATANILSIAYSISLYISIPYAPYLLVFLPLGYGCKLSTKILMCASLLMS